MFLSQRVPLQFIVVSDQFTIKALDLIGRLKTADISNSPMIEVAVVSAIPGMERRISYSGRGFGQLYHFNLR